MAFQAAPGIAQFEMVYGQDGEVTENVYHVANTNPWTATNIGAVISALRGWESGTGAPQRSNTCSLFKVIGTDLSTPNGVRVVQGVTPVIPGTGTSAPLPNNCTIAIKAETGLRGRSNRGRTFWIGLVDAQVAGNFLVAGSGTLLVAAMNNLITVLNGVAGCTHVLLSRRNGGAPRPVGIGTPITQYSLVDFAVDSQRRRLPLHNRHR